MAKRNGPYALLVKKQTFLPFKLPKETTHFSLTREAAVKKIVDCLGPSDIVVGTTGMLSRELYEYRSDFLLGIEHFFSRNWTEAQHFLEKLHLCPAKTLISLSISVIFLFNPCNAE